MFFDKSDTFDGPVQSFPYRIFQDAMQTYQEAIARQSEIMSTAEWPFEVEWREFEWQDTTISMPVTKTRSLDPEWTRNAFHTMAEINMRQWEHIADMTKAMPDWSKAAFRAPSDFWATVFDQWMRLGDTAYTPEEGEPVATPVTTPKAAKAEKPKTKSKPRKKKAAKPTPDDLTLIKGIGPKLSEKLAGLGIVSYAQIAAWTPEEIDQIDDKLQFKGRIQRESWVEQAQKLART